MPRVWIAHDWKIPKILVGLMVLELPLTVLGLVLFGVADPNTYRTKLWQDGANAGFNSDPSIILYSYANYKPIDPPLVWSQEMTTFNVVVSVLSMFILLVKSALFTMHFFYPALSVLVSGLLVALWANSLASQVSGDFLDPNHPSPRPWYLTKSCSIYASPQNTGYCLQARASVYCAAVMMILFLAYLGYSLWCCFPTEAEKQAREADRLADLEMKKLSSYEGAFELGHKNNIFLNLPKTPMTPGFGALNPMTPRTTAFTRLNGGAMPEKAVASSSTAYLGGGGMSMGAQSGGGGSRALPFREQYGSSSSSAGNA